MTKNQSVRFGRVTVDPQHLRDVLIEQRTRLGLSHRALAEKAGVAPTTVYNLEQGSYKVQLDKFLSVLGALDLLPENVLEIDSESKQPALSRVEQEIHDVLASESVEEALLKLGELLRRQRSDQC